MKRNIRLSGLALLAAATMACSTTPKEYSYNQGIHVVPIPVELTEGEGTFTLTKNTALVVTAADLAQPASYFAAKVEKAAGYNLKVTDTEPSENYIKFVQAVSVEHPEGYRLSATPQGVVITASTPAGAFYGMQTLLQLLPAEIESPKKITDVAWTVPAVTINDYPRFAYRGSHLDVCRHFSDVGFVKKHLDVLAMFKVNIFHWHFTEDQLWPIEIKRYPELRQGSTRTEGDGSTHGGWITQEEMKEVVAYAAERHIQVIPEIEMPGHAVAALVSHPELSCTGGPFPQPSIVWGVRDDVYCAGKEATFEFLENVLREMAEIFPCEYIHLGGDECPKTRWEQCPDCQRRIDELGLRKLENRTDKTGGVHTPEEALQSYFVTRMEKFANSLGKKIIGWDEILEGGLAPSATVMSWRGEQGGIAAAMQDHYVIMTPQTQGYYLDHYQGAAEVEPTSIGGNSTLEKVYAYNPIPAELPEDKHQYILGAQGNMWAEYRLDDRAKEYMLYPRTVAIAEVNWSPLERKDWNSFTVRVENSIARLGYHDINYYIPRPEGTLESLVAFTGESVEVPFENSRNYPMFYTLDGTEPTEKSARYEGPLTLTESTTIKIVTQSPQGRLCPVRTVQVEKQSLRPAVAVEKADSGMTLRIAPGLYLTQAEMAGAPLGPDSIVRSFFRHQWGLRPLNDFQVPMDFEPSLYVYEGIIELPEDGVYTFATDMDELWIDGELLVYNDQSEASRHYRHKMMRALQGGHHSFKLVFNNMIKHGWPNAWSQVGFMYKAPSDERYQRIRGRESIYPVQ